MDPIGASDNRFLNRELSWLDFNDRVLTLAEDPTMPLLERAKFLAIFANNLDEFYMVRVAGLKAQQSTGLTGRSADGLTPIEQLDLIERQVRPIVERHARLWSEDVMPALAKESVEIVRWKELDDSQRRELHDLFRKKIFPVVTPLAVDPGHPFPYISNLSLNLAVMVRDPSIHRVRFARLKVPPLLPRFIAFAGGNEFVPIEDVIAANLENLFPGMEIVEHHAFRVSRNADLEVDDDGAEDLLEALEEELRKRRFSPAVRLEIEDSMPPHVLDLLRRELQVDEQDVHSLPSLLDLTGLFDLYKIERPDLKDRPFQPATHDDLATRDESPADVMGVVREKDILIHHPYESFRTSVQRFVEQAATDPDVLAIKQTLYRTSGQSPIVDALIDAAQRGKQVVVLVEIKARFDERANINWARTLERAGCHVVYGLVGLKTHCKLCLVVRQEGDGLRRYVHVGTGNYNEKTAREYEDLGLLTAEAGIGADVSELFNYLTGYSRQTNYRSLLVAPHGMRERIVYMIEEVAASRTDGKGGRVALKLNSLVDETIIDALYAASQAGVPIDLLIRGMCALRPGVPGLSETIRVKSVLGKFLEHSRIFYFEREGKEDLYIGSADMMHRNLDRRVEVLAKVESVSIKEQLKDLLGLAFKDDIAAWALEPSGRWTHLPHDEGAPILDLQQEVMARIADRA